jgi:hypothetical protein
LDISLTDVAKAIGDTLGAFNAPHALQDKTITRIWLILFFLSLEITATALVVLSFN